MIIFCRKISLHNARERHSLKGCKIKCTLPNFAYMYMIFNQFDVLMLLLMLLHVLLWLLLLGLRLWFLSHLFPLPCGAGSTVPREGFDSSVIMPFSWCVVAVTLPI